ncbi:hypothetical protein B0H19DRAFT_1248309 [Mycena capillaripes]|nr:hypothetical protein B0H19DRAFT_1248309 [Mycena capillaripes]
MLHRLSRGSKPGYHRNRGLAQNPRVPVGRRVRCSLVYHCDLSPEGASIFIPMLMGATCTRASQPCARNLKLEATEALEAHQALVRHSWDHTSIIWQIEKDASDRSSHIVCLPTHKVSLARLPGERLHIPVPSISPASRPDTGNMLLTKWPKTADGVCKKTIDRATNAESITYFPVSQAFLSVEDNMVTKLVRPPWQVLDQYDFGCMKLHDVADMPDGTRLVGVGPLLESPTGLHPSKSPLVVYNTELKQIEQHTYVPKQAAEEPFMFVTGGRDGGVRIWTQPEGDGGEEEEGEDPAPMASPTSLETEPTHFPPAPLDVADAMWRQELTMASRMSDGTARAFAA